MHFLGKFLGSRVIGRGLVVEEQQHLFKDHVWYNKLNIFSLLSQIPQQSWCFKGCQKYSSTEENVH